MKFEDVKYRLNPGEEVRILKGVKLYAKPGKVVFIKEYPHHLLFEGTFEDGKEGYGVRTRRFSINKSSLWCGYTKVQRVSDGAFVGMKEGEEDE